MPSSKAPPLAYRPTTWVHYIAGAIFTILSALAFREMHIHNPVIGFQAAMDKAIASQEAEGIPVLTVYTGIKAVDATFQLLVTAFTPAVAGTDEPFKIISMYFLWAFLPMLAVFYIEAGRKANQWSLVAFPAAYVFFYQTIGGAIIIPLYFVAHIRITSKQPGYYTPTSLSIPPSYAKALIPSVLIGYALPTILMYLPIFDLATQQRLTALWQPSPMFVGMLIVPLSAVLSDSGASIKSLNAMHGILIIVSVLAHWATMAYCFTSPNPTMLLTAIFDPRDVSRGSPMVAGIKYIFQVDFWVCFSTAGVWMLVAVYDLRLEGRTDVGLFQALLGLVAGYVVLGPAAVLSAVWCWREQVFAGMTIS